MNRRVIGPVLFWLKLIVVSLLEARIVKSSQAQLVLAPGETLPEVLTVWLSSRITGRQGAVIAQSDPFLILGRYRVRDLRSFYAAYRTLYPPPIAFVEALTAQAQIRAMNKMALLIVGRSLSNVLASRGIRGTRAQIVENGVDQEKIRQSAASNVISDAVLIGRIDPSKGVMEFLRAWTSSGDAHAHKLTLIGPVQDRLRAELTEFMASHGDSVRHLGVVTDKQRVSFLKASRVSVLPSYFEAFPLAVAEALACGVPVVCYDSPWMREFFPTPAAILVPKGDIKALVTKVQELLQNEEARLQLAKTGLEFASRYNWDKVAAEEARIYRDLVTSITREQPAS